MYRNYIKRILDIGVAIVVLIFSLPAWVIIAVIIKLESEGPVLFVQERTGVKGEGFDLYKFRTMLSSNNVHDSKSPNKITRTGRVLRIFSLDELPQFINIMKGQMSLIGPRPWIPQYYKYMTQEQRRRVDALPGVTGLAQASGRNDLTITEKLQYDISYIENQSFWLDIGIIYLTAIAVVKRSGHEIDKSGIHNELKVLMSQHKKPRAPKPILGLKTGLVFYSKIEGQSKVKSNAKPKPKPLPKSKDNGKIKASAKRVVK